MAKVEGQDAEYEFEFDRGNTYLKIRSEGSPKAV